MRASKGFTLIELAVVIAIIAILAAVAVPRFANVTQGAQQSVARDFLSQLTSAAAIYTATALRTPVGFDEFVTPNVIVAGQDFTLSTANLGDTTIGACAVAAAQIDCSGVFDQLTTVQYNFNGGAFTANIVE